MLNHQFKITLTEADLQKKDTDYIQQKSKHYQKKYGLDPKGAQDATNKKLQFNITLFENKLSRVKNPIQGNENHVFVAMGDAMQSPHFHFGHGVNDAFKEVKWFDESLPHVNKKHIFKFNIKYLQENYKKLRDKHEKRIKNVIRIYQAKEEKYGKFLPQKPTTDESLRLEIETLTKQIGDYNLQPKPFKKSNGEEDKAHQEPVQHFKEDKKALNTLYKGIEDYEKNHVTKIIQYIKKTKPDCKQEEIIQATTTKNPNYFREQFIRFIVAGKFSTCPDDLKKLRTSDPKAAAIKMQEFFDETGTALYKLALEEEMNSREYRDAVYHKSKEPYAGEKWTERPIVFVGGPSASGKSYASKEVLHKVSGSLKKRSDNNDGNQVVFVDGGIAREVSQIRKLALTAAINQGYTGIKDLHKQSKVLEKAKKRIFNFVINHTEHGVVIPETFSKFINLFDTSHKILNQALSLPHAKIIFTRIAGKNPKIFQKVVEFMGSSRAWKTDWTLDKELKLDLNADPPCESKAYDAKGFTFGEWGSRWAEADLKFWHFLKKKNNVNLYMLVANDLLLKREDPKGSNQWVDAKYGDSDVIKVSERVFNAWQKWQKGERNPPKTLKAFNTENQYKYPPLISTPTELTQVKDPEELKGIDRLLWTDRNILKYAKKHPEKKVKNLVKCMLARLKMIRDISTVLVGRTDPTLSERLILIKHLEQALAGAYDFNKSSDRTVLIQACDSASNEVKKCCQYLLDNQKITEDQLLNILHISGATESFKEQEAYVANLKKSSETQNTLGKLKKTQEESKNSLGELLIHDLKNKDKNNNAINSLFEINNQIIAFSKGNKFIELYDFYQSLNKQFGITVDPLQEAYDALEIARTDIEKNNAKKQVETYLNKIINNLKDHKEGHDEAKWRAVLGTIPRDPVNYNNIFSQPVSTVESNYPRHEDIRKGMSHDINHYRYIAPKGAGGAQESGPLGGWYFGCYKTPDGRIHTQRFMIKRESQHRKNIIESLCGRLKSTLVNIDQDYTAGTYLVRDPHSTATGINTYAVSIAFSDFKETHKLAGLKNRVKMAGTKNKAIDGDARKVFNQIKDLHDKENYTGLEEGLIASWLTGDSDVHSGNIGASTKLKRFLNIDHAGGMLELDAKVHPNRHGPWQTMKRFIRPVLYFWDPDRKHPEPTYHAHEYPTALRCSEQMATVIARCTNRMTLAEIKNIVEDEINHAVEHFNEDPEEFRRFAKRLGVPVTELVKKGIKQYANAVKTFLPEIIYARLINMRQYGKEIELSLCFEYDKSQGKFVIKHPEKLESFIRENPNYCLHDKHHFRGRSHGNSRSFLYHVFHNKFGVGAELESLLKSKTEEILQRSDKLGIDQFLAPDLSISNQLEHAKNYITRLRLLKQILAENDLYTDHKFKNKIDELIESLTLYSTEQYQKKPHSRKQHLIQICDAAYDTIRSVYETLKHEDPKQLISKIKIFEIFNKLHHDKNLITQYNSVSEDVPLDHQNLDNEKDLRVKDLFDQHLHLSKFSTDTSAFVKELENAARDLKDLTTHIQYSEKRRKNIPELQVKQQELSKILKQLAELKEKPQLLQAKQYIEDAKKELEAKPEIGAKQEYFTTTRELIKKPHQTFEQQASEIFKTDPVLTPQKTSTESIERQSKLGPVATKEKAVILENPGNKTEAGAVLIKDEFRRIKMVDFPDPTASFAHVLAVILQGYSKDSKGKSLDLDTFRQNIQKDYIDKLQSKIPPETVTEKNLAQYLRYCSYIQQPTRSVSSFFGQKTFVNQVYQEVQKNIQWHPQLLLWANIWIKTLEAQGQDLCNLSIKNSRGNPEFVRLLLILLCLKGVDPVIVNQTGYEFKITQTDLDKMNDIMSNPNNETHKKIMGLGGIFFEDIERDIQQRAVLLKESPPELRTVIKRIEEHLHQPLDDKNLPLMKERFETDRKQLQNLDKNGRYIQLYSDILPKLTDKIREIDEKMERQLIH